MQNEKPHSYTPRSVLPMTIKMDYIFNRPISALKLNNKIFPFIGNCDTEAEFSRTLFTSVLATLGQAILKKPPQKMSKFSLIFDHVL